MAKKQPKVKSLDFRNHHLLLMVEWLDYPMKGRKVRIKTKFIRLIGDVVRDIMAEKKAKLEKYVEEGEKKGSFKIENKEFVYQSPKKKERFIKEYGEILDEVFILDVLPSNEQLLKDIGEMFLDIDREFDTQEGVIYDYVCEEFEKL